MKTKKELTQNEKLMVIFDKLLIYLSPTELKKDYYKPEHGMWCNHPGFSIYKAECNFLNANNMPDLFLEDFAVEIKEDNILIMGENMEYNFAPDQILTIYNRIKKTLKN
jgi:hypothetical protein